MDEISTKDRIRELREENPRLPAATIAEHTGVSRQRVSQILRDLGLATKIRREYTRGPAKPSPAHDYGRAINPTTTGAISELIVSVDLMARGCDVYRALSACSRADLVCVSRATGAIAKIEVRSAKLDRHGLPVGGQKPKRCGLTGHDVYDVIALALPDGEIVYNPPIDSYLQNP